MQTRDFETKSEVTNLKVIEVVKKSNEFIMTQVNQNSERLNSTRDSLKKAIGVRILGGSVYEDSEIKRSVKKSHLRFRV